MFSAKGLLIIGLVGAVLLIIVLVDKKSNTKKKTESVK